MIGVEQLLHFARISKDPTASEGRQLARWDRSVLRIGVGLLHCVAGTFLSPFSRHELKKVENFCGDWLGKCGCFCLELLSLGHVAGYVLRSENQGWNLETREGRENFGFWILDF